MMSVPTRVLLQNLQDKTELVMQNTNFFYNLSFDQLCKRPPNNGWSIAECLQHLILYGNYYLPQIKAQLIPANEWTNLDTIYKATWLGNWFANAMLPNENNEIKKMKAAQTMKPTVMNVKESVLQDFIQQQNEYKNIFANADKYNINKNKINISILPFVKINVGDAMRFCINHNVRHIHQAIGVFKQLFNNEK